MAPLPEAVILVLAPYAPLFSPRLWLHAQILLLGAMLTPGASTVTAVLRAMGLTAERHFTDDHRVLNRATISLADISRIKALTAWQPTVRFADGLAELMALW
jgi:nucleoside-diphosphate-sugar epimerase